MSDTIGRITVPSTNPTATFPLVTDYAHGKARRRQVITHTFGAANAKIEQRYHYGDPSIRYTFHRQSLSIAARRQLRDFFESVKGPNVPFYYNAPNEDGTTTQRVVCFENAPLSLEALTNAITSSGVTFMEVGTTGPTYPVNDTVTRFPNAALATALQDQAQEIIPLVRIRVLDTNVPDIYVSDRRVTVGPQLYLPRLLRMNEPGSNAIITQSIDGSTDDVTLTFGNADRVMVQLSNDTQLRWARVELSLYHVGSGIVLQLWAGYVTDWHSDSGPEFVVRASDILSALTLSSPIGSVSRTCWRRYQKDGCPASGALDLAHFPNADANSCDLGYNTPNGCMAHQATQAYGATYCSPQGVLLRSGGIGWSPGFNNGAGFVNPAGWFISTTSTWYPRTSIIEDSIFGGPLPEIWHNDDGQPQYGLPVACRIAAGRDEDQFYSALGIVGRGPLGAFTQPQMWQSYGAPHPDTFLGSTLDGQPNHGFQVDSNGNLKSGAKPLYGLRQALGADPAGDQEFFSLGRVASSAQGWFIQSADGSPMLEVLDASGTSAYNKIFSAGTALCEIRRTKPNSDPVTAPGQHTMVSMVSRGLTGLVWTAQGVRSNIVGCVNPFWVSINTYLRAIGMLGADASKQEEYFDADAAIAAAQIADADVPKIIGAGTETQFRFKGVIGDRKPTRDWLQAILNSACGYYTWSFGRLKVGCRDNASAVSAFTCGNILFGSLQLTPVTPRFEKLTVQFSDQEYQFQSNTVDYADQDLAARNNRVQNPLASQFAVSGCPTKSQAARIALVRAREESGGVTAEEQDTARLATWRSTILALDTEAGSVVSITDPDVPGGAMNFRVLSMRVNTDWSVDLMGKTVTPSMYDHTVGPKPADVEPGPIPTEPLRDSDVPPEPSFAAATPDGFLELVSLSFPSPENTRFISAGSFAVYYVDDTEPPAAHLAADLAADGTTATVDAWGAIASGDLVEIDGEILLIGTEAGNSADVSRGQKSDGTSGVAAAHQSGSAVRKVSVVTRNESFPGGFFDGLGTLDVNPRLIDWKLDIPLPNKRALAAEGYVVNPYGPSPTHVANWTGTTSLGLIIGSVSVGVTPPPLPASVTIAEKPNSRVLEGNALTDCTVTVAVHFDAPLPDGAWLDYWHSTDGGVGYGYLGKVAASGQDVEFEFAHIVPYPGQQTWKVKVATGIPGYQYGPDKAVASNSLVVESVAPPANNLCPNAVISGIDYLKQDNGQYTFTFRFDYDTVVDPNFWTTSASVQWVTADGTPCPEDPALAEEAFGIIQGYDFGLKTQGGHSSNNIGPWWVPPAEWTGRVMRIRLYVLNRNFEQTLQLWPDGKDYCDVPLEVKYYLGGNYPNVPAPNVVQFDIGTQNSDGTFTRAPHWDTLNEKMIFDWAAYLPADISNIGYVRVWCQRNGLWIESPMVYEGMTAGGLVRDSFSLTGSQIPQAGEQVTFVCASANKLGITNQNPLGTPTGLNVTVTIGAPNKGVGTGNLSPGLIGGGLGTGSGQIFVKPGAGLSIDWSGAVVPNIQAGGGIGLDGANQFYVPLGSINSGNLASGTLSDLSKYTSDKRPIVVAYGTPALPNSNYPNGALLFNTYDGKLYRNVSGTWKKDADPADLVAGTLAAGVVYAGRIAATQIDAGMITVGSGGLSFSGTGGIAVMNGGNVAISPGNLSAQGGAIFQNLIYGFRLTTDPLSTLQGLTMDSRVSVGHYFISGNEVIDASQNGNFATLKIGGTTVIDAARNLINVTLQRVNKMTVSGTDVSGDVTIQAGTGISLSASSGLITITNSDPGSAYDPGGFSGSVDWIDNNSNSHSLQFSNGICTSGY